MDGHFRFILKVIPALVVLLLVMGSVSYVASQIETGWGVFLGVIAAMCLGFGVMLAYWMGVGWINYRYIKKFLLQQETELTDGQIGVFSGIVKIDGEPLIAPFSQQPCAGYKYSVSHSRSTTSESSKSSSIKDAEGLHLLPTTIENEQQSLRLRALPTVDESLKINETKELEPPAIAYLNGLVGVAPAAKQIDREAAKIKAELFVHDSIASDYCMTKGVGANKLYSFIEERIPVNESVCVVGTYNKLEQSMTGEKARFGPNLMLYRGSPTEVVDRERAELGKFTKIAAWMMAIYAGIMLYATVAY